MAMRYAKFPSFGGVASGRGGCYSSLKLWQGYISVAAIADESLQTESLALQSLGVTNP